MGDGRKVAFFSKDGSTLREHDPEMCGKLLKGADLVPVKVKEGAITREDIQFIGEVGGALYFGYRRPNDKGGYDFVRLSYALALAS
ncbi:hypothetical protein ACFFSY_25980 [Paenibacillus aurantiacus]|uniref:Uncharacterized protein n=1 Tax=Paenibacillus aurantiacus TaxID=1936118 RepID=A0ABV5KVZ5_9BACL